MARRRRPPRAGALAELQPMRTIVQIFTLQALYYLVSIVLIVFTALVAGMPFSLDLVVGWHAIRGDTTQGWLMAFVLVFDGGFCMAVAIVILIGRSKLVPDFALTIQFLHLVVTSLYARSLPAHSMWWFTTLASSALCIGLGMWGCQYRELQPVFFGGRILNTRREPQAIGQADTAPNDDTEVVGEAPLHDEDEDGSAVPQGRSRGRGRDGQGEYEMVQMKSSK